MLIKTDYIITEYQRVSKMGKLHTYSRKKEIITFSCDNCGEIFQRYRGSMNPKRLTNNVYHVCGNCDAKRFAQQKGIESKHIWDLPVSSLKSIDQL